MLRKHQSETDNIIKGIISGSNIKSILCKVTPGGGKSAIPIIAGKLVEAGLADSLCWVVPRKELQDQGERNFIDPYFRKMLDHDYLIRSSTNEPDPCRGLTGFATTYQAIGIDGGDSVLFEFYRKRFVLILDEFHHVENFGVWHKALGPIVRAAAFVIYMTGTIERGDGKQIAFIPYDKHGDELTPRIKPSERMAVVEYNRSDALAEKAIIPLRFFLSDGKASWINKQGTTIKLNSIAKADENIASQAVFTVLNSEYADQLLNDALRHWQAHRKFNPRAKLLVVTVNFERAEYTLDKIKAYGFNTEIATSHNSEAASKSIRHFKAGIIDILVTIAMAYEGMDVPEVTHICCLTNIRSTPWIEQMVARAVRIDRLAGPYESQVGHIFAPDDPLFRKIVGSIKKEQLPFILATEQAKLFKEDELMLPEPELKPGAKREEIQPLGSELTGKREMLLGNIGARQTTLFSPAPKTPKEIETDLRDKIESHIRSYAFMNRYHVGDINTEIKKFFGKPRASMTIPELENVMDHVARKYPHNQIRGRGKRVTTRVEPWPGRNMEAYV